MATPEAKPAKCYGKLIKNVDCAWQIPGEGVEPFWQESDIYTFRVSLIFWGELNGGSVSFNGQTLAVSKTGSTANFDIYSANISPFAGQTGQLLFTTPLSGIMEIDNIQFSSSTVPEPGVFGLAGLGALALGWCRRQKHCT